MELVNLSNTDKFKVNKMNKWFVKPVEITTNETKGKLLSILSYILWCSESEKININ